MYNQGSQWASNITQIQPKKEVFAWRTHMAENCKTKIQSKFLIPINNVGDIEAYKHVYYHLGAWKHHQSSTISPKPQEP